jgi:hypothetical protein
VPLSEDDLVRREMPSHTRDFVGLDGIEPSASALSGKRSPDS